MDISTKKLNEMEAKLTELLATIAQEKEEPTRVLNLINPTADQYSEAWETLATMELVEIYAEMLLKSVQRGNLKKVGLFLDFTLYELDRFGETDSTQTVVYNAQQLVKDIYSVIRKAYFTA